MRTAKKASSLRTISSAPSPTSDTQNAASDAPNISANVRGRPGRKRKADASITLSSSPTEKSRKPFIQMETCITLNCKTKVPLPPCLDCFCLLAEGKSDFGTGDEKKFSDCRFRGSTLRKLQMGTRKNKLVLRVAGLAREKEKSALMPVCPYKKLSEMQRHLWFPHLQCPASSFDYAAAMYILSHIVPVVKELLEEDFPVVYEQGDESALKSVPEGERESCDVCSTSIFNVHYVCAFCGFAVCLDCKKKRGHVRKMEYKPSIMKKFYNKKDKKDEDFPRDEGNWLLCCSKDGEEMPLSMSKEQLKSKKWDEAFTHDLKPCRLIPLEAVKEIKWMIAEAEKLFEAKQACVTSNASGETLEAKLVRIIKDIGEESLSQFRTAWTQGYPVVVSGVHKDLNDLQLWTPQWFSNKFGKEKVQLTDCSQKPQALVSGRITTHKLFWDGFASYDNRVLLNGNGDRCLLKIKDWPMHSTFRDILPQHFTDLMAALPINQYSNLSGQYNLAKYLPKEVNPPDLGPKMYIAYGSAGQPKFATTNLHVDISDAVNVIVHVAKPTGTGAAEALKRRV